MESSLPRPVVVLAVSLGFVLLASGAWAQAPWTAPDSEKNKKSPVTASPKVVEQSKKVAQVNCASCHGTTGKGNGPAAMALSPKPADWTSKKVQDETDGEIFWEDHDRSRRHAVVEAPARERPLGARAAHPVAQEVARRDVRPSLPVDHSSV